MGNFPLEADWKVIDNFCCPLARQAQDLLSSDWNIECQAGLFMLLTNLFTCELNLYGMLKKDCSNLSGSLQSCVQFGGWSHLGQSLLSNLLEDLAYGGYVRGMCCCAMLCLRQLLVVALSQ